MSMQWCMEQNVIWEFTGKEVLLLLHGMLIQTSRAIKQICLTDFVCLLLFASSWSKEPDSHGSQWSLWSVCQTQASTRPRWLQQKEDQNSKEMFESGVQWDLWIVSEHIDVVGKPDKLLLASTITCAWWLIAQNGIVWFSNFYCPYLFFFIF